MRPGSVPAHVNRETLAAGLKEHELWLAPRDPRHYRGVRRACEVYVARSRGMSHEKEKKRGREAKTTTASTTAHGVGWQCSSPHATHVDTKKHMFTMSHDAPQPHNLADHESDCEPNELTNGKPQHQPHRDADGEPHHQPNDLAHHQPHHQPKCMPHLERKEAS